MIKRTLFNELRSHLHNPEISLIVGPRQAGKTTLMRQLQEELDRNNQKTLFLSLDNDSDLPFFASQETLIQKIEIEIGKGSGFIFIDEIQRKENAGLFLKGIYDRGLPYKLVVSGSGSMELKEKIHESLAGRKRVFTLSTLSFTEFSNFKTDYRYEDRLLDFLSLEPAKAQSLLDEYLNFGGYPKVVLATTGNEKTQVIQDIYQSYLEKDIAFLLNIHKTESITHLVRILASQVGKLVNVSGLSSTLGISAKTVNNYLWYLEKTFVTSRVTPFFKNVRKEITKTPVLYFIDLGLKNYALRRFGTATLNLADGFLFQNFIFGLLREDLNLPATLHFWRTQNKAEVDFVIDTGRDIIPIEVKYSKMTSAEISSSFRSFLSKYLPKKSYVIHLGPWMKKAINNCQVIFLPFFLHSQILASQESPLQITSSPAP